MPRVLPPLNAVRTFEAAARHLSFTRAASELHVTQAAVSHQVKALEEWFGGPLFQRTRQGLSLTNTGQAFLPAVREALDAIASTAAQIRNTRQRRGLAVSVQMSLAASWLIPRLYRFQERHPDIDVWISASDTLMDFAQDGVDLGIRQGLGRYPGLAATPILVERMFPTCSPAYLDAHPLCEPADLKSASLIWDEYPMVAPEREGGRQLWGQWFAAAGVADYTPQRGYAVSHANLALQMALEGRGVALTRTAMAATDLATGRLVRPFRVSIPAPWRYYAVCPAAHQARREVRLFRDWLAAEGRETMLTVDGNAATLDDDCKSANHANRTGGGMGTGAAATAPAGPLPE